MENFTPVVQFGNVGLVFDESCILRLNIKSEPISSFLNFGMYQPHLVEQIQNRYKWCE